MRGRTYRYMTQSPLFPFGFGLSYTQFSIGQAELDAAAVNVGSVKVQLNVPVQNVGQRQGTEVVQLYVRRVDDTDGPVRSLRGFQRVSLRPGQQGMATFELDDESFLTFDPSTNQMRTLPGQYEVFYGTSSDSRDLKCVDVTLK